MLDAAVSPRSIARAVNRRGERWGISAMIVGDKVKACDEVYEAEVRGGIGVVRKVKRPLCTVDEDHPFSAVLFNRVDNGETDLARRYRLAEEQQQAAQKKQADAYDNETRRMWRTRKRITVGPGGMSIPAGFANRWRQP